MAVAELKKNLNKKLNKSENIHCFAAVFKLKNQHEKNFSFGKICDFFVNFVNFVNFYEFYDFMIFLNFVHQLENQVFYLTKYVLHDFLTVEN